MDLPDLKKLNKIIALCRKQGVETIDLNGIKITLGSPPVKAKNTKALKIESNVKDQEQAFQADGWDDLSEEDRLLWSSSGNAS